MRSWALVVATIVAGAGCGGNGQSSTGAGGGSVAVGGNGGGGGGAAGGGGSANGGAPDGGTVGGASDGGGMSDGGGVSDGGASVASDGGTDGGTDGGSLPTCTLTTPQPMPLAPPTGSNPPLAGADDFLFDGDTYYAITRVGKFAEYYLYAANKDGSGNQRILRGPETSGGSAYGLAADGSWLFLMGRQGGIARIDKSGANYTSLAPMADPATASIPAGGILYYTSSLAGTVDALDETTGAITALAAAQTSPSGLALDDSYVYYTADTRVLRVARQGGSAPETVLASAGPSPQRLALDGELLVVGNDDGTLVTGDKAVGSTASVVGVFGDSISALVVDHHRVYLTTATAPIDPTSIANLYEVLALDEDGGNQRVVDPRTFAVLRMTTDDTYVYYSPIAERPLRACK